MFAELEAEFIATRLTGAVGIFGRPGDITSIEIPDSPMPLLLSRQAQKTLGTVLDFDQPTVSMKTLGVHEQAVLRAHGGHFTIRVTDFPPEGHPGLVEEWECNLASSVAKKRLPLVAEVVGEEVAESAADSDASTLADMNEDVTVAIVDEVCFTEAQVFKMSSNKAAKLE